MPDLEEPHQAIGEARIEIYLNDDWDRQQDYGSPVSDYVLSLKREDEYQGYQQRYNGHRAEER
jgi:hypothetical protein